MSDKKRRWFQIHLSTAIVMMFVAGGFLALNFKVTERQPYRLYIKDFGFPKTCLEIVDDSLGRSITGSAYQRFPIQWYWNWWLCADVAVCLAAMAGVGFLCEWRIRRREAREP